MRISFAEVVFLLYCINECVFSIAGASKRSKGQSAIPSKRTYAPAMVRTATFAAPALLAAISSDLPVWGSGRIDTGSVLLGLAFLVLTISIEPLEQKFTAPENRRRIGNFLPRTARERFSWVLYCIVMGVGEEIIYRAVLFGIFFRITGDYWMSAAASAVFFGLNHIWQGMLGIASTFFVGLCLQWLVKISGGLYVAIGVHFLHNLINGILWGILFKPEKSAAMDAEPAPIFPNAADSAPEG